MKRVGLEHNIKRVEEAKNEKLLDYDIVCLGSPSHMFLPAEPVLRFIREKVRSCNERGLIKPCAPKVSGKHACVFCTYSGPHTGIDEAIPAGKCMRQFLEHLGFEILAEWYVIGEFHGNELLSTIGKLGNIKGRPNEQDLKLIEENTVKFIKKIRAK